MCETPEAFVARAVALATADRLTLRAYRERLIANRDTCTLFDIDGLARKPGAALPRRWRDEYRAGALPQPNLHNLDAYLDIGASFDHDSAEIGMIGDYHGHYRAALAARHAKRPMTSDGRLWNGDAASAPVAAPRADKAA